MVSVPSRSFNLADLFEGAAEALPDQDAVVTAGADEPTRRCTYAELDARANQVAHVLADLGVGPHDHVAVHAMNCLEFMEITLGVFKLRAVPVNGNFRYTTDELRYVFDDAEVSAVFTQSAIRGEAAAAAGDRPLITIGEDYEDTLAGAPATPVDVGPRSSDDRYLLYTGGTTGMPKGVVWRHEDVFFGALGGTGAPRQGLPKLASPDDIGAFVTQGTGITRRLPLCPLIHGGAQWIALTALLTGGTCLLTVDASLDAGSALRLATDERAEFLMIIGDAVARPLADELRRNHELYDLSALRLVSSSGAILSPAVKAALEEYLPATKVIDRFGASETGGQGRIKRSADGTGPLQLLADEQTTVIGDDGRPLTPGSGERGRLARSGWIPLGYWKDEEKAAATFPTIDGVRYSVPGDLATIEADGTISVFGRGSMVINTGGEKVFPEEVEAAVKGHPAIFDSLVVGVPDDRFGSRVAAVVSLQEGAVAPTVQELGDHCRTVIAGYKVPRELIVVEEVVRKVTGKGDYGWAKRAALEAVQA
ncbi:MAG: AMP-binding protein [Acidimicrobiales bacterium]|nr:AMP-binding protein [Acidimicrobiales bacterium]